MVKRKICRWSQKRVDVARDCVYYACVKRFVYILVLETMSSVNAQSLSFVMHGAGLTAGEVSG